MAKQITLIKVFVASPGDVDSEREALEHVIRDLNVILGKTREIQLDLVKWETHAYPSLGKDVQSVINEQIGDNYDIFVGVLWKRFGTPTPQAMSGTAEEFNRAYKRYKENPDQIRVMIYFNESPVSPSELDPEQLSQIKQFRDGLGDKGVLYWSYTELGEFTDLIRMHLSNHITDYGKTWGIGGEVQQAEIEELPEYEAQAEDFDFEDYGFLDLIEIGTENFDDATETAGQITNLMVQLRERTENTTAEFKALPKPTNVQHAKRIIDRSAEDLEHFAARMKAEVPRLTEKYRSGVNSYGRATELWLDFGLEDKTEIENAVDVVRNLKSVLYTNQESISEFRDAIRSLPRITAKFNRAKRNALYVIDEYMDDMAISINITTEVEKTINRIINEGKS